MAATQMLSMVDHATHHRPLGLISYTHVLIAQGAVVTLFHNFHIMANGLISNATLALSITNWYKVQFIPRGSPGGVCLGIPAASLLPTLELKRADRIVLNNVGAIYRSWDVYVEMIHSKRL